MKILSYLLLLSCCLAVEVKKIDLRSLGWSGLTNLDACTWQVNDFLFASVCRGYSYQQAFFDELGVSIPENQLFVANLEPFLSGN